MPLKICLYCGEKFKIEKYRVDTAKYCSSNCYHSFSKGKWNNTGRTQFKKGIHAGKNHSMWKGNKVGYRALHEWVVRQLGKASRCSDNPSHISTVYHWANISQKYKRDISDWRQACPSCNYKDRRILK